MMQKIIQQLTEKLNRLNETEDFGKLKLEMLSDIHRLATEAEILNFKLERALKDKNVVNSLLTRTSEDLKNALRKKENQSELLKMLLNTIPALVYFKDNDFRYQLVNKAFLTFSGLSYQDVIGKKLQDIFSHHMTEGNYQELEKQVIENGSFFYNVEEQVEQNRKKIWVHTNIAPVRNKEGEIIGLIGVSWDISSQKDYEFQLKKARDQAEEGVRIKDRFLANMSHEIRTPLNGIFGMAEILNQTSLEAKQKEYLDSLLKSTKHLMGLIEDVFEFSAIETGRYKPEIGLFHLPSLLEKTTKNFKKSAKKKGISFHISIDTALPDFFTGDQGALRIILRNLLSNGIKFTHKGQVELRVFPVKSLAKDVLWVRFEVEDSGIGISNRHLEKIFDSFSQADTSTTKNYQGTGLGLAISERLVRMMRGRIGVESNENKGSLFWFEIPLKTQQPETEDFDENKILEILKGFRILLVEDNLINQKISKITLEKSGCRLEVAANGKEGVEKYKEKPYDLILMDIQMPVMDGLEATRQIRKVEKQKKKHRSFIVALTANATENDRKNAQDAGMDGFIAKPFNPKVLFRLLYELIVKKH